MVKIGIDLRALQTGHKFRGIGEVAKQVTNRVLQLAAKESEKPEFIFYEYDDQGNDPKKLLHIPPGVQYEVVTVGKPPLKDDGGKLHKLLRDYRELFGEPVPGSRKSDVFLQFDYAFGVPRNTKTLLIKHDLIPYVFWSKYFTSAWVHVRHYALRTTLRTARTNLKFMRTLRRSLRNATEILAVSTSTKNDVMEYFHVPARKVKVALLGVDIKESKTNETDKTVTMPTKPYLLFIGAGDARRRVEDAVAAFNNLKAEGHDIQLVLVGENFKKLSHIPNPSLRKAVLESSYIDDILALGYIDDATKQQLYKNTVAFVYPTLYEGFGIPILEAMLFGCPTITYKNSSTPEVGGPHALYAKDWMDIKSQTEKLLAMPAKQKQALAKDAQQYAAGFTWDKTAKTVYRELTALAR